MNLPTEDTMTIPSAEEDHYFTLYQHGVSCPYCLEPLMPSHVDDGHLDEGFCCDSSAMCFDFSTKCAFAISALEGMQPQLRHTPPYSSSSIHATFSPSCPSRIAHT